MGQYFKMHEGTSSGSEPRRATSLQSFAPTKVTYSNGTKAITLQEVLSKTLQFSNGVYIDLPPSIKVLLDNLYRAYTRSHHDLFQRTLKALEIHLVNLETGNAVLSSQLFDKENIHSMDKMTIMGINYARLSLKTQATLRSAVANLPSDIQVRILESKAMSESHDQWSSISSYWSPPISQFLVKIQMTLMISSSIQIGMITLGAVLEFMKRNIIFQVL